MDLVLEIVTNVLLPIVALLLFLYILTRFLDVFQRLWEDVVTYPAAAAIFALVVLGGLVAVLKIAT